MTECSQCTITFTTSTGTVIYVPRPLWNSVEGQVTKDLQLFNMWAGAALEVVDKGMNEESITIGGIWSTCGIFAGLCFPICFPICFSTPLTLAWNDIRTTQNNDSEITIDGLGSCLNGVYIIQDFQISTIKKVINSYAYTFVLQKVRDL